MPSHDHPWQPPFGCVQKGYEDMIASSIHNISMPWDKTMLAMFKSLNLLRILTLPSLGSE